MDFAADGSGVRLLGGSAHAPLRYARALQLPLRLHAELQRSEQCSNHFLALCSAGAALGEPGARSCLHQPYIHTSTCLPLGQPALQAVSWMSWCTRECC